MDTLQNMINNKLVNSLNTYGKMVLGGMYEDCIFGKYISSPYNGTTVKEKEVLKYIYINLWGLAQVQLAGGILLWESQKEKSFPSIQIFNPKP